MENSGTAVKALIIKDGKVLLIKRNPAAVHDPGGWDIPGGRLNPGEEPLAGLVRETLEETGLEIEMVGPVDARRFTRDDGQRISMTIFLCRPKSNTIRLSEEHTEYKWVDMKDAPTWLADAIQNLEKYRTAF